MKNARKRPPGMPREVYLRKLIDHERKRREALEEALKEDLFGTAMQVGVLSTDIRRMFAEWDERVRKASEEDRVRRDAMRKELM